MSMREFGAALLTPSSFVHQTDLDAEARFLGRHIWTLTSEEKIYFLKVRPHACFFFVFCPITSS